MVGDTNQMTIAWDIRGEGRVAVGWLVGGLVVKVVMMSGGARGG